MVQINEERAALVLRHIDDLAIKELEEQARRWLAWSEGNLNPGLPISVRHGAQDG